jgi:hypothetical protein
MHSLELRGESRNPAPYSKEYGILKQPFGTAGGHRPNIIDLQSSEATGDVIITIQIQTGFSAVTHQSTQRHSWEATLTISSKNMIHHQSKHQ